MKSLVVILESAADHPRDELDGRTPLAVARCPAAARIASEGLTGVLGKAAGRGPATAEARLAAFCGLEPDAVARVARGPLEAASLEIDLSGYTHAYRGDLVTLDRGVLRDGYLARLTLQETEHLAAKVQERFDPKRVRLLARAPGRLVVLARAEGADLAPGEAPWLLENDEAYSPPSHGGELLEEMIEKSVESLARHAINDVRVDLGENPANAVWLWGGGPLARLDPSPLRLHFLTQSAMAAGLARLLGAPVEPLLDPWSATQPTDVVDAAALRQWITTCDRFVVYVEAPPEFIRGPASEKVHLLERTDVLLLQPLLEVFRRVKQRRFLLAAVEAALPEDSSRRTPQPIAVWGSHLEPDAVAHWDETSCRAGALTDRTLNDLSALLLGDLSWP